MARDRASSGSVPHSRSGDWSGSRRACPPGRALYPPLVLLAAAVAMIRANLLLDSSGRTGDFFAVADLVRLPLRILTGMGFGAVLRRGGLVLGVTTAATLWFVTVVGLCFGGGQILRGIGTLVLGLMVLSGLRWFETRMKQEQHATLNLTTERDLPAREDIYANIQRAGYEINAGSVAHSNQSNQTRQRELQLRLQWKVSPQDLDVPPFLRELPSDPNVLTAQWEVT